MLIIRPIQDKEIQKELCRKASLVYHREAMAYLAALSDDAGDTLTTLLGVLQFDVTASGEAIILPTGQMPGVDDLEAMIIMGRAAMSFIYRTLGIKRLSASAADTDASLLSAFGMLPDGKGGFTIDLEEFFSSPCGYSARHGGTK